jgi:transcriptional regulator GlxA family with amidase domain
MNCTLLALDGCPLSSVSGPMEIFSLANSLVPADNRMSIRIVSEFASPVNCVGGVQVMAHCSLDDVEHTDLLILGAIGQPTQHTEAFNAKTLSWIQRQYKQGAQVVSICSGAFLLAATGLLDGREATTHWACEQLFRERYPKVHLKSDQMITQDGALCCSGGASAYQDMALFLVRQYYGDQIAHQCAKAVLIDLDRHTQQQYASFRPSRQHQDSVVNILQDWLKFHATESFSIAYLAEKASLSERQLKRRFKQATGETPLVYIQALRMEAAKHALETSNDQVEKVSNVAGYEDVRFFRQLFKRYTGLSPSEYRRKFGLSSLGLSTHAAR